MRVRTILILSLAMSILPAMAGPSPAMANGTVSIDSSLWDRAVDNLLAAGMYGLDLSADTNSTLQLQRTEGITPGVFPEFARLGGHVITFSYRGSSGLLGFSAGYIYTSDRMPHPVGSIAADLDAGEQYSINPGDDWFMAIDLSSAYQVHEDLAIGVGGKTMLMKNPGDRKKGRMLSLLLNMPMSYRRFITITPELQWSHSLSKASLSPGGSKEENRSDPVQDIFYGGVSITFSY